MNSNTTATVTATIATNGEERVRNFDSTAEALGYIAAASKAGGIVTSLHMLGAKVV